MVTDAKRFSDTAQTGWSHGMLTKCWCRVWQGTISLPALVGQRVNGSTLFLLFIHACNVSLHDQRA